MRPLPCIDLNFELCHLNFIHSPMARWALLLHTLPDGTRHFDWLIQPARPDADHHAPGPDDRALVTFRTHHRPDDPAVTAFPAERLPDHRSLYLTYEGPIAGDRGHVRRLAEGRASLALGDALITITLHDLGRVWLGRRRPATPASPPDASDWFDFRLASPP
jgi:hypothetical protein